MDTHALAQLTVGCMLIASCASGKDIPSSPGTLSLVNQLPHGSKGSFLRMGSMFSFLYNLMPDRREYQYFY
jgi:hypothetical protein